MRAAKQKLAIMAGILANCAVFTAEPARADVITTFDLNGEFAFNSIPFFALSGSVTIDTTLGTIIAETVGTLSSGPSFFLQGYDAQAQSYFIRVDATSNPNINDLIYFNTPSLVGYTGGALGSLAAPTAGGAVSGADSERIPHLQLTTGTATPEAVPEPGSIVFLAVGLGLAVSARTRRVALCESGGGTSPASSPPA